MPFIGTQPEVGGYSVLDALTASATASYTLQLNSANFVPSSVNQLLVSLNGVIQKPGSSFTVSGSTLTFSSALTSSDSIDFIISMGEPLLIGTPSDATVTGNKLASDIGISTTGNIATTGSGTITSAGKITSSAGITFGSDTAAANVLDDYEEGSFTATAGNSVTLHSNYDLMKYTKIGNLVTVTGQVRVNSDNSNAGFRITNFPFPHAPNTEGEGHTFGAVRLYEWDVPAATLYIGCFMAPSTSTCYVEYVQDNGVTVELPSDSGGYAMFGYTYPTNS